MPHVLSQRSNPKDLLAIAQSAARAASQAFQTTDTPFYGMEYRHLVVEYNQLVTLAARIIDGEVSLLFRLYDLSAIPAHREIPPPLWRLHLHHVTTARNQLAAYLQTRIAMDPEPTVVMTPADGSR